MPPKTGSKNNINSNTAPPFLPKFQIPLQQRQSLLDNILYCPGPDSQEKDAGHQ